MDPNTVLERYKTLSVVERVVVGAIAFLAVHIVMAFLGALFSDGSWTVLFLEIAVFILASNDRKENLEWLFSKSS